MLPEQETEYEALIQFLYMAPIGLAQIRVDGEILLANPPCAQLLMPLSLDGDMTNFFALLEGVAPDLRYRVSNFAPKSGMICEAMHLQLHSGAGSKNTPQFLSLSLLKLNGTRLMAVLSDVTREVIRERQLRQSEAWVSAIYSGVNDYALISLDKQGLIDSWNLGVERLTGFSKGAILGHPYSLFYPQDGLSPERLQDYLHEADKNGWSQDEGWRMRADGTRFWGNSLIAPLQTGVGSESTFTEGMAAPTERGYSLIIRDISEKREAHEALRKAATTDYLTGLANRRVFYDAAELEIKRWHRSHRPLALLLLDADHFKRVNDTWGHPAGDAVLRMLGSSLTANFREVDVVARIGGEEFAVLLASTSSQGTKQVAQRMCEHVAAQTVEFEGNTIAITVSVGIACMDDTLTNIDMLMKRADEALYRAKTAGRNGVGGWAGDTVNTCCHVTRPYNNPAHLN